jgi:hypothetical protein
MSEDQVKAFLRKIRSPLAELRAKGLRDIRMAVTYDSLDDPYELREMDRALSPESVEDRLALDEVSAENYERQRRGENGLLVAADVRGA